MFGHVFVEEIQSVYQQLTILSVIVVSQVYPWDSNAVRTAVKLAVRIVWRTVSRADQLTISFFNN